MFTQLIRKHTRWFEELAFHWAPIHYQDVNKAAFNGRADYITSIDREGNWNITQTWLYETTDSYNRTIYRLRQDLSNYVLDAWAYYSVVSTTSHYYITYAFYHPLDYPTDWVESFWEGTDYNDLEGALFIIKRDGTEWGKLEAVITTWHSHFHAYYPRDTNLVAGCVIETQGNCWIEWEDGRVMTSQEWGGHGIGCYPAYVRQGDDAVVYVPSKERAGVPPIVPDGTHERVPYRLVDIHAPNGLWSRRRNDGNANVFNKHKGYLQMIGGHGNPPWAWDDGDDGGLCLRGAWTHDPVLLAQYYFKPKDSNVKSWVYFRRGYLRNQYREDMTVLTHSNARELYSNPNMSLDYWIKNYGGNCRQYGRQYPCE